ncbi:hypothetical protein LCGC14_0878130 [marine sediment metagenome]|uniref:Uncharacterized protein n=1 Tax=marine sediment metagenome TaxID=412755 RepID=A0A0F9RMC1_9ZZZZ
MSNYIKIKGELQTKKTIDDMFIHYWENGENLLIGAFHRPNAKEQAILSRLVLCWNSHGALTKQRDALLAACEYNQRLLTENIGQATHAIALNEAAIAKAIKNSRPQYPVDR